MLKKIKNLVLGAKSYAETAESPEERQQLALAALLVGMARADFDDSQAEHDLITELLATHYELSDQEAVELLNRAGDSASDSVCLFDYTRALHDALDAEQKQEVIRLLWEVANADKRLDKYEDYLVRKVADLLYVPHSDVVRIKHEVLEN